MMPCLTSRPEMTQCWWWWWWCRLPSEDVDGCAREGVVAARWSGGGTPSHFHSSQLGLTFSCEVTVVVIHVTGWPEESRLSSRKWRRWLVHQVPSNGHITVAVGVRRRIADYGVQQTRFPPNL